MICMHCRELRAGEDAPTCARCGTELVAATQANFDRLVETLVHTRMRAMVGRWRSEGLVDTKTTRRMLDRLGGEAPAPAPESKPAPEIRERKPSARERREAAIRAAEHAKHAPPVPPPTPEPVYAAVAVSAASVTVEATFTTDAHAADAGHAARQAEVLFHADGEAVATATQALDVLAALDAPEAKPAKKRVDVWPILYENVGWFVGALLVLAGSVYGVREAWRTLGDVARHAIVAGAFLAYHAGFAGMAALLAKKAPAAGKVLGVIATGLLTVVFAAAASLVTEHPAAGWMLAATCAGVSWVTLRSVSKRLEIEPVSMLPAVLLVPLVGEVGVGAGEPGGLVRALLPFAGLGALAYATRTDRLKSGAIPLWMLAFGGAVALEIFAAVGMPGEPDAPSLSPGTVGFAFATLRGLVFGGVVASLGRKDALRTTLPTWAGLLELVALAAAGLAAIASGKAVLGASAPPLPLVALVHASVAFACGLVFTRAARLHAAALHFVVPSFALAATILVGAAVPDGPEWWTLGSAFAAAACLVASRRESLFSKAIPFHWSLVVASAATVFAWRLDGGAPQWALVATGTVSAAGLFAAAARSRTWVRYLAAAATLAAGAGAFLANGTADGTVVYLAAAAAAFGIASLAFERAKASEMRPLDDVSLATVTWAAVQAATLPSDDALSGPFLAGTGALMLLRSLRDASRLVSGLGATLLALGLEAWFAPQLRLSPITLAGAGALAAMLLASLRGASSAEKHGRSLFGAAPLPWPEAPRALVFDGFALAAGVELLRAAANVLGWFAQRPEEFRMPTVAAALCAAGALLVAFLTPAARAAGLRGHAGLLWGLAAYAVGAGVTNRVGRPLPPDIVGSHLTEYAIALWLAAMAIRRYGPALGEWLEAPTQGPRYHFVPHAGVFALFAVLSIDTYFIAAPSFVRAIAVAPPTLVVGPALLAALLARSMRRTPMLHVALAYGLVGATMVAVQHSVYGSHFVALDPPGGRWVPLGTEALARASDWRDPSTWLARGATVAAMQRQALEGVAIAGLSFAGLAVMLARAPEALSSALGAVVLDRRDTDGREAIRATAAQWSLVGGLVVVATGFFTPVLPAAVMVLAAGAVMAVANSRRSGLFAVGLSIATIIHAVATNELRIPGWAGVACALTAFAVVAVLPAIHRARPGRNLAGGYILAALLVGEGLTYALASGGIPDPLNAGPQLMSEAFATLLSGRWVGAWSIAATLALSAITAALAAVQARRLELTSFASPMAFFAGIFGGFAVLHGIVLADASRHPDLWLAAFSETSPSMFFWRWLGPALALAAALSAAALHATNRFLHSHEEDDSLGGWRASRDVWFVFTAICVALFLARNGSPSAPATGDWHVLLALAALVFGGVACAHVAYRESTPRHVYMVQSAAVGVYGVIRTEYARTLPPEADALFALLLGFVLVGVTVVARRRNIPPVAQATRRFAALLPIAIGLVLPFGATPTTALFAAGSGALWGALGWVENSRLFGSLGAGAVNLALLFFALSSGMTGVEIYLAPLGLFVMALGQIFRESLHPGTRQFVRVLGGLLVYLPSAWQIAFQVGSATDGTFPVIFGGACLVGILAGMALHIRAYLALGTMFLTLDVVASLVRAGLRDNRVGFALLSAAGLGILGLMVFINLQRELVRRLSAAMRARLSGWD